MRDSIQVIERAIKILSAVSESGGKPLGLSEIALRSGLKLSTAARIAQSLVACACLEQPSRKKGYLLGPKIFALAGDSRGFVRKLVALARPLMAEFSAKTGEHIDLAILADEQREIIASTLSTKSIHINTDRSMLRESPYKNLSGRLLLAGLPETAQRRFFNAYGAPHEIWPEVDSVDSLVVELAKIRDVRVLKRTMNEISGVCSPLLLDGVCKATVGAYVPNYRYCGELAALIDSEIERIRAVLQRALDEEFSTLDVKSNERGAK